eukprot:Em0022g772a
MCAMAQGKYVALKQCAHTESCLYTYSANQASSMSGSQSELHVSSTVEVFCESVGKYDAKEAKQYCLRVKETSLSTDEGKNRLSEISSNVERLLNGPFCFVQTEDGKIVSVHHDPNERSQIVNFKKGIAAAFQANFKNTHVEVEEDTQSKHHSRYSYERIAPDHVIMHRIIDTESVIQFATSSLNGKPFKVERAEDIEYKEGKLLSSTGTTVINMNGPVDPNDDFSRFESSDETMLEGNADTFDSSFGGGGLTGTGKYSLRLQTCSKKSRSFLRRSAEQQGVLTASNLHAVVQRDAEERVEEEMNQLRQSVPSIRKALEALKENMSDTTTSSALKKLLILESEHGPLSGYQPAVSEIVDYLNSENDFEMRALLHSFLVAEGSVKSQEILLHALRTATDRKERNSLSVQLAFVRNVHPDILAQIENLIVSSNDTTDSLILSYGALAASSPDLRQRIVQFLQERVDNAKGSASVLIHLIHSLGNTESSLADSTLLQLIAHDNSGVRLAAVYALRYSVESKDVQNEFLVGLRSHQDTDFVEMVARALIAGAESKQHSGTVPVGDALFEALLQHAKNDTELRAMVYYYVMLLGQKAPKEWKPMIRPAAIQKRDTTWNDNSDPLYNLVQDSNTRSSDITNYPVNRAYIWSKSLGVSDIRLDLAFGAFAGLGGSANPTSFKLFAKGIARGYAFGYTATAFEALITSENKPGANSIVNRLYVSIVGKVLVDYSKEIPTCEDWSYPLYQSPDYTLLNFKYSIFIYVGTLNFSIGLSTNLGVTASLTACINTCLSAKAALTPHITIKVTARASITLIEVVRIGIKVEGSFEYQVNPQVTGNYLLLRGPFEFCLSLTHGWPKNFISLYVYYQLRSIIWSKGCHADLDGVIKEYGTQLQKSGSYRALISLLFGAVATLRISNVQLLTRVVMH